MSNRVRAAFALVLLAGCVLAPESGSSGASSTPTAEPSIDASAPVASEPVPASGSPAPSASADPAVMDLEAIGCPGGVVLSWTPSTDPRFHHYTALRSPSNEIEPDYPPIAPAVDWGETYATDPFVTSAFDASVLPSIRRWNYRVMAYDETNAVVSASPVRNARIGQRLALGDLTATSAGEGVTSLEWRPFGGFSGCFSSYRIVYGTGAPPRTVLSVVSDLGASSIETDVLHVGTTYQLRVDAIRDTTLGSFIVGQSETIIYTVP